VSWIKVTISAYRPVPKPNRGCGDALIRQHDVDFEAVDADAVGGTDQILRTGAGTVGAGENAFR